MFSSTSFWTLSVDHGVHRAPASRSPAMETLADEIAMALLDFAICHDAASFDTSNASGAAGSRDLLRTTICGATYLFGLHSSKFGLLVTEYVKV